MRTERKTKNVFSELGKANLSRLVTVSRSISHLFDQLQLRKSGASFKIFRRVASELQIDYSHFVTGGDLNKCRMERPIEDIFREGSNVSSSVLRNKVRKHSALPYKCQKCPNDGRWNDAPLCLHLDHINGKRNDNRIENLRFLCPNCHSQTETYCGRKPKKEKPKCPDCGRSYSGAGRRCRKCSVKLVKRTCTIKWPSDDVLAALVWQQPLFQIAKEFMCSDTGLRKHCRRQGILYPPMGYWTRRGLGYSHEESLVSHKRLRTARRRLLPEHLERALLLLNQGLSLRKVAQDIGFSHQTLMRAVQHHRDAVVDIGMAVPTDADSASQP